MPHIGDGPADWKERARRAEAEAAASRTQAYSASLKYDALVGEYNLMVHSKSWKMTKAIRQIAHRLRSRRNGA